MENRKSLRWMGMLAGASLLWLLVRTGKKPSRIIYPCQKAAVANIQVFALAAFTPLLTWTGFGKSSLSPDWLKSRRARALLMMGCLLLASGSILLTFSTTSLYSAVDAGEVLPAELDLEPQTSLAAQGSSNLFFIQKASKAYGNMDGAFSSLLSLMESHGTYFHKTSARPTGLIAGNDVVIIKVNSVGPQRSGTNTDLVKALIEKIVSHPEGFTGEVVVADNGQGTGGLDLAESNAYDHSQSFQDVANMFPSYKVSAFSWYRIAGTSVGEYGQGNYNDGYVMLSTPDPTTGYKVNYPKFRTKYGTYISFKNGVWSGSSYSSSRLKVINCPVLKSHYYFGVTACVKNYHGVDSQTLEGAQSVSHGQIALGALGVEMASTRFPILNILDAIYVNANPIEYGRSSGTGPQTTYSAASYTDTLGASRDPVALEYWAAKNILIPAAKNRGYTRYSSLDPDYEPKASPELIQSYHTYLEYSMNELKERGYQATMDSSLMNVYVISGARVSGLTVTSPNGGQSWMRGTVQTITWTSSGSVGANVKIELLKSGVLNKVITSSTANDGSHSWAISSTQTQGTDYKVRVTSTTNPATSDSSNSNFAIVAGTLTVTSPNGGQIWRRGTVHTITWTKSGSTGSYVRIELLKGGVLNKVIISSTANDGSHSWTISSTQTVGTDYRIRITSTTYPSITDSSNGNFAITA